MIPMVFAARLTLLMPAAGRAEARPARGDPTVG